MGEDKLLFDLSGDIKTPPMSTEARRKAGQFLRYLQQGEILTMPHAKRIEVIGPRCYELRISDHPVTWRLLYRVDEDAIIVLEIFSKKTRKLPNKIIKLCRQRLRYYDDG